jgi:hypothetical protein
MKNPINFNKQQVSFSDMIRAMQYWKYLQIQNNNAWFTFYHPELKRIFSIHNPEGREFLTDYQLEYTIEELKEAGLYNEKCNEI